MTTADNILYSHLDAIVHAHDTSRILSINEETGEECDEPDYDFHNPSL